MAGHFVLLDGGGVMRVQPNGAVPRRCRPFYSSHCAPPERNNIDFTDCTFSTYV
jgi:hypothetical protein